MKRLLILPVLICLLIFSCSKEKTPEIQQERAMYNAEINGVLSPFTIEPTYLYKYPDMNQKDLILFGTDREYKFQFILALYDHPHTGDGMTEKSYLLRKGLPDNPLTSDIDESEPSPDASLQYAPLIGNSYDHATYYWDGVVTITSCDEVNKKVSGTFSAKVLIQSKSDTIRIKNGKFTNIPYQVN